MKRFLILSMMALALGVVATQDAEAGCRGAGLFRGGPVRAWLAHRRDVREARRDARQGRGGGCQQSGCSSGSCRAEAPEAIPLPAEERTEIRLANVEK